MGFSLNTEYWRVFFLALIGGWLGVLFMIPLRRQLIVKEHGNLTFPEGTACADVLVAGERGGSFAGSVFWGLGIGGVYTWLMNSMQMWPGQPEYQPEVAAGRVVPRGDHVGISRRRLHHRAQDRGHAFCRRRFFVARPDARDPLLRPKPDRAALSLDDSHRADVAGPAVVQLHSPDRRGRRGRGRIDHADSNDADDRERAHSGTQGCARAARRHGAPQAGRLERDLPMKFVLIGSVVLLAMMWALLTFKPIPGAATGLLSNLAAALLVIVFGFLFVTVSCRICGLIGTSSNPVSGMTIATLMATCAMFLVTGWTAGAMPRWRITIGGVVAIAAANAGATSQDLKTGYLVGATPVRQQIGLIVGVLVASFCHRPAR